MVLAAGLTACGGAAGPGGAPSGAPSGWSAVPGQVAEISAAAPVHDYADPVELRIPSIGVRSRLERLGTDDHGELRPPRDPARAGWFGDGVQPGDPGPAVIAGHVDSRTGPAVFTRLPSLTPGSAVVVMDAAGAAVTFRVEVVRSYPKASFPTRDVYGATPDPQLRLITCGGGFDRARGHYPDNVIVYAGRVG
jgi:sortase (surface protein transpeptidase)